MLAVYGMLMMIVVYGMLMMIVVCGIMCTLCTCARTHRYVNEAQFKMQYMLSHFPRICYPV